MATLGQRLRLRRTECGISQTELGRKLNMNHANIGKYERGIIAPPVEVVKKIAELLDTSVAYLMGEAEQSPALRDNAMAKRLDDLMTLPDGEREHVLFVLDAVLRDARARTAYGVSA